MVTPQQLAEALARNARVVHMQAEGLSHADSLTQTPYNINCLNWVIGHILASRERILELLGELPLLSEAERSRYARESQPIREDGADVLKLERLLELLDQGQERIAAGLLRLEAHDLGKEVQAGQRRMSLAQRLFFLYFHDTYHAGQTELLRQMAGKNDKVI